MSERRELAPRVEVREGRPSRELRRRVAGLLAEGDLVALPTETVYGLAARADAPQALERLQRLKGTKGARGLTWHVANRDAVERFEPLRPLARRLAARYWPGPLTLVLQGVLEGMEGIAHEGWTGVRLPAHQTTQGLIEALDFPVCLTSANPSGEAPATDADRIEELFGAGLALIVDAGPSRLGEASGVLRLGPGSFELLREGLLPVDDLRRTAGLEIGFCCTGNTCRSPMAEALARHLLAERLGVAGEDEAANIAHFGFEISSFGVLAPPGAPASDAAVEVMAGRGISLRGHRSRPATPELVRELDLVYCLTQAHLDALRALLPPGRAKKLALLDPEGRDIPDPIGGSVEVYRECSEVIEEAMKKRAVDWA